MQHDAGGSNDVLGKGAEVGCSDRVGDPAGFADTVRLVFPRFFQVSGQSWVRLLEGFPILFDLRCTAPGVFAVQLDLFVGQGDFGSNVRPVQANCCAAGSVFDWSMIELLGGVLRRGAFSARTLGYLRSS